jgi:hypothetical protein
LVKVLAILSQSLAGGAPQVPPQLAVQHGTSVAWFPSTVPECLGSAAAGSKVSTASSSTFMFSFFMGTFPVREETTSAAGRRGENGGG